MDIAFIAVSALVPSLLLMAYFHQRDAFPEPQGVLWTTFGLGVLITVPVSAVAMALDRVAESFADPYAYGFASAFLGAAIPEELFKLLVLWFYAARHFEFDEPMDGIVYGVAASLGFASLENVLYVAGGGVPVAILRALSAVPGHAFLGAIMGFYVGQARFDPARRRAHVGRAIAVPIVLHGLYDFPLLAGARAEEVGSASPLAYLLLLAVPAVLVFEWGLAVGLVRRLRRRQVPRVRPLGLPAAASPSVPAVAAPTSAPAPAPGQRLQRRLPGTVGAWGLIVLGGLAASAGGLLTLGVLAGALFFGVEPDEIAPLAVGTSILGLFPLGLGVVFFIGGIRRLNRGAGPPRLTDRRGGVD